MQAGFASNGYGAHSPGGYSLLRRLVCEVVMTFAFLFVILGSTHASAPKGFAPHRHRPLPHADPPDQHSGHQHLGEPGAQHRVRRCSPAAGRWQLWLFWLAPLVGAAPAGVVYRLIGGDTDPAPVPVVGDP